MKCFLHVLATTLLLFSGCSGALEGTEGKPDRIVVLTDDDPSSAYQKAAGALIEMGYAISYSDETLRTVTTEYREAEKGYGLLKGPVFVKLNLSVSNTEPASVTYRGTFRLSKDSALGDEESEILKRGMSNSPAMIAWEELEQAAGSFPGGKISTEQSLN